jgi:flagellar hook-associated protein 1 FlgK
LTQLSQLINIRTHENENGVVSVFCGSDPLIVEGTRREVFVGHDKTPGADLTAAWVCIEPTNNKLDVASGRLHGLYQGRDEILGGFAKELDQYASSLIWEFNKLYASGQGLTGYDRLTSLEAVNDANSPLNATGLNYSPVNGVFSIMVTNTASGKTSTTDILVSLTEAQRGNDPFGVGDTIPASGMSLADLAAALNAIDGIRAIVTNDNRLEITAESTEIEFSFTNDTSGVLAALGVNTFFTGTDAKTIGVNQLMYDDPSKFAASGTGVGADTKNSERLASMPEVPLNSLNNLSITQYYRSIYDATTQKAGTIRAMAAGDATYYASLEAQKQSISGVNLDEETINLLTFQRSYQASARYVTVINEMLYSLLNM